MKESVILENRLKANSCRFFRVSHAASSLRIFAQRYPLSYESGILPPGLNY